MIDLKRFTQTRDIIVPIVGGWAMGDGRKMWFPDTKDGWYKVRLDNKPSILERASVVEVLKNLSTRDFLRVYALGQEGIPLNFDNFFKRGLGEAVKVNFLDLPVFEIAKVVFWEDKRFYFYEAEVKLQRRTLQLLKEAFEQGKTLDGIKHISPEIFYYWLLINLQSQAYKEANQLNKLILSKEEKEKRVAQFQNGLDTRLAHVITQAGGELIKFVKSNKDTYLVHWKVKGTDQVVKSTIHDDLRIISAGFCLDSQDKLHTVGSIVQLAKMFQEEEPLYITRQ